MNEEPGPKQEQKTKSYKSSVEEVVDYLEGQNEKSRQRRAEGRAKTPEEVAQDVRDVFRAVKFFKNKGSDIKSIGKETFGNIIKNPWSLDDMLTQGVAKIQKTVAEHMREELEKEAEIKGDTLKSLLDVEEEEQRLAAMRANLDVAEALLHDRKQVLTGGRQFTTMDPTGSLKDKVEQTATRRRESGQQAADSFFGNLFGGL